MLWKKLWAKEIGMKKYEIPETLALLQDKARAAKSVRDIVIKIPLFGFWHARRCAIDYQTFDRRFWNKVCEIYPELKNKKLQYVPDSCSVFVIEGKNNEKENYSYREKYFLLGPVVFLCFSLLLSL